MRDRTFNFKQLFCLFSGLITFLVLIIIKFPKFLKNLISNQAFIEFDYANGIHRDFILPIYLELKKDKHKTGLVLVNFNTISTNWKLDFRFRYADFIPDVYTKFIKKRVTITALDYTPEINKNPFLKRIQIFHGFTSIGPVISVEALQKFDRIFMNLQYMNYQIHDGDYKNIKAKTNFVKIGYPKIDRYVNKTPERAITDLPEGIFYGPTYHVEISSIFNFLASIGQFSEKYKKRVYIKLHPFLLKTHDFSKSGGINWIKKIKDMGKINEFVSLVDDDIEYDKLVRIFNKCAFFLTDTSGLGYEYSLITGRPVVFLGTRIKIPLNDLRKNSAKYSESPEIKYRGIIGPIINEPTSFELEIEKFYGNYSKYIMNVQSFKSAFTFNLGSSTPIAVKEINSLYHQLR